MKRLKRFLILSLSIAVAFAFTATPSLAAGKNYMPVKVTAYTNDSGKYVKMDEMYYTYNKRGDATSYKSVFVSRSGKLKYQYKKGKITKMTVTESDSSRTGTYKKGKLQKVVYSSGSTTTFAYNKKGRISKKTDKNGSATRVYPFKYKYYGKNKVKKVTSTHRGIDGLDKMTDTTFFNKAGYVTKFRVSKNRYYKVKYKKDKKKRVTQAIITKVSDRKAKVSGKFTFKYKKAKTSNSAKPVAFVNLCIVRLAYEDPTVYAVDNNLNYGVWTPDYTMSGLW